MYCAYDGICPFTSRGHMSITCSPSSPFDVHTLQRGGMMKLLILGSTGIRVCAYAQCTPHSRSTLHRGAYLLHTSFSSLHCRMPLLRTHQGRDDASGMGYVMDIGSFTRATFVSSVRHNAASLEYRGRFADVEPLTRRATDVSQSL